MSRLLRLARARVSSEALDVRVAQIVYFVASPALLILSAYALARHATTPGEVVVGLLAAVAVSLLCVLIGLVLPMTRRRTTD